MFVRALQRLLQAILIRLDAWLALQHPKLHHRLFGSPDVKHAGTVVQLPAAHAFRQVGLQRQSRDWSGYIIAIVLMALLVLVPLFLRPNSFP